MRGLWIGLLCLCVVPSACEESRLPLGGTCGSNTECASGLCVDQRCANPGLLDASDALQGGGDVTLVEADTFSLGFKPCGLGFDSQAGRVWVFECLGAELRSFRTDGTSDATIPLPGEAADDGDIDIAPADFVLGTTAVSEGGLLFINGETGLADVYALDPIGGSVLGSLETGYGASHVVGGAYHAARGTLFVVQDRQVTGADKSRVVELDPVSGAVLGGWQTTAAAADFTVNFGDIDVCQASGNLFVVSSDESTLAEFTPAGALVGRYDLPPSVTGATGLDFDDQSGDAWLSATSGTVWRLTGLPCRP